jgi:hypothetical protein
MNTFGSKQVKFFAWLGLIIDIGIAFISFQFLRKSGTFAEIERFMAKFVIIFFSLLLPTIYYLILRSIKRRNINKDEAITIAICNLIFMIILQSLICCAVS